MTDVLSKTEYSAPFDGVITNLPVREGETVVIGIQNAPGSTLMTIADTSVITAEVKVDETDIVNVKLGQPAEVTIDAIPKQQFQGTWSPKSATMRSSAPPAFRPRSPPPAARRLRISRWWSPCRIRPTTCCPAFRPPRGLPPRTRNEVLSIPIQALTVRQRSDLDTDKDKKKDKGNGGSGQLKPQRQAKNDPKEELQGVFVLKNKKDAVFVPVTTGIAGTTDIEVTSGLKEGDEIVTGSYKVLRTLRTARASK